VTEALSVIVGALIGAGAGLAGGGFAALASLRASQLAARAPLASVLQTIANMIIWMNVTKGTDEYLKARRDYAKRAVMRSHRTEVTFWPTSQGCGTSHNTRSNGGRGSSALNGRTHRPKEAGSTLYALLPHVPSLRGRISFA
jgi:hypothetical protein